uniref:Uncharacterized protein n=1 Tax=Lepeophtheirus salmonis TaxID=72036 RepID=A0A0K2UG55_LEPSM
MTLPTVDRCTFFFLVYSDIFIVGVTLNASMTSSGFTLVVLLLLGLSLRLSPSARQFLIQQTVVLLKFNPFMMSKVVHPVRIKLPMIALLASIGTYT